MNKTLLLAAFLLLSLSSNFTEADPIKITTTDGKLDATCDVLEIIPRKFLVPWSIKIKLTYTPTDTRVVPLSSLDRGSLYRLIIQQEVQSRASAKAKTSPPDKPKTSTPDTSSSKKYQFVTAREFEVFREKYNKKDIAMHVEFYDIPSALAQRAVVEQDFGRDKYMAFGAFDTKRQYFSHFVADKNKFSKQLFSLERGDKITVYGWGLVLGKPTDIGGPSVYFIVDAIKKR